jgi:outer membrane cobalamin receptor
MSRVIKLIRYFNPVILILFSFNHLFATGNTGNISGKVIEKRSQQPLISANIVIQGTTKGASTDEKGNFLMENLEPGSYNLRVHYLGYKTILKSNVIINPKRTTVLVFEMEEDILESDAVEVTASYFEKAKEAVVSTRSMDFEEIRRDPGSAIDIQRVMQALPAVVSGSDQDNEIIIRGGIPGENLFLMDNIEIPNPNHFGNQGAGGGPINMLNTYMIRGVDFYAGAFSAKYGDKASSVMDISLRDGSKERFRGEAQMGMAGAGALIEGPIPKVDGTYIFSARKSFLDLIVKATGLVAVPQYYNLQGKLVFNLNPKNILMFNGIYGNDKINIEGEGTGGYSRGAENVNYFGDEYAFGLTLRTFWSDKIFSYTTLSSVKNNWEVDVYRIKANTRKTYFRNNSIELENTLKTDFVYQLSDKLELNYGASYKSVNFDHDIQSEPDTIFLYYGGAKDTEPDSVFKTYPPWVDKKNVKSYKTALYSQISVDILKRIRLTGGLRYDYFHYNKFQSISPRLGASFFLNHKTTFNIAYGIHYQSPAYIELTANPKKNKSLKSKYTQQYVAGIEYLFREDIKLTIEAFYKTYHDVPIYRSSTTAYPFDSFESEMINEGTGYAQGIEFFLQKKLTENFSTTISYSNSISKAKDPRKDPGYGKYYNWDYDYRNVFTFIGGYKIKFYKYDWYNKLQTKLWYKITAWLLPFGDEVEIGLRFRYLGGRPYTPPVYHPEIHRWLIEERQKLNTSRYPIYSRLDFRLDRRFIFDSWNMVVYFDMMNVYNRHNVWQYQYNEDGTTENVLQFEVLPVGGVSLEF